MPRTALSFFVLTCHLTTTIVVFSSRARPQVYDPPESKGVIALFHAIDAPEKVSRFEVLKFRMDKLIQWASLGSAPQQQPSIDNLGAPSCNLASVAAPNLMKLGPSVDDNTVTSSTSPSEESDSNTFTPFASHRPHVDRHHLHRAPTAITEEVKDQCKVQYHLAW
ncbi:MAG: hypothetical protein JOS17DRAFT_10357 [Linnemannia elongata]|nr:MAG: hypothetical protein JOS17DRAFT_10357 [Linnemannia elongata]